MDAGLSNGSAFAGLNTNMLFYNFTLVLAMLSDASSCAGSRGHVAFWPSADAPAGECGGSFLGGVEQTSSGGRRLTNVATDPNEFFCQKKFVTERSLSREITCPICWIMGSPKTNYIECPVPQLFVTADKP
jgi:hypothetical protein